MVIPEAKYKAPPASVALPPVKVLLLIFKLPPLLKICDPLPATLSLKVQPSIVLYLSQIHNAPPLAVPVTPLKVQPIKSVLLKLIMYGVLEAISPPSKTTFFIMVFSVPSYRDSCTFLTPLLMVIVPASKPTVEPALIDTLPLRIMVSPACAASKASVNCVLLLTV